MIIEKRTYVREPETKKRKILAQKYSLRTKKWSYKLRQRKKTFRISPERYFSEIKAEEKTELARKLERKVEVDEEYEEYEYFIGFDYQTPAKTIKGTKIFGEKGKHDFRTEFKIVSPVKLEIEEMRQLIQNTFSDYGVLKDDNSYSVKSEATRPTKEKISIKVKFTKRIER